MLNAEQIAEVEDWLNEHQIGDVECMTMDLSGVARGKSMLAGKFIDSLKKNNLRIPDAVFGMAVTGEYISNVHIPMIERDITLVPDLSSLCVAPWQDEPTATVICDAYTADGDPFGPSARHALRKVLQLYRDKGWEPIVAPEFEFYLLDKTSGPKAKIKPPIGETGWRERGSSAFSIDAVDDFAALFSDVYDYCEAQEVQIDALVHEDGAAQFEININHGEALRVADQAFLFKRIVRKAALKHGFHATFMAKPYPEDAGSSMHLHQSVVDVKTGTSVFATSDGSDSDLFLAHIAGLQKYIPAVMPILAPYFNSYRRLAGRMSSPVNTHWGRENRTVGLRVPESEPNARRVENRIGGSDVNPYLAIAASLGCGYLGMVANMEPDAPLEGNAYDSDSHRLPIHYLEALDVMRECEPLRDIFDPALIETFIEIKEEEHSDFLTVLSPWETEYLTLTV